MARAVLSLSGVRLELLPSGALFWPARRLLCVSDLHLGKSSRMARGAGPLLPPYETAATLERLDQDLRATDARTVVCLGDSFDDDRAAAELTLADGERLRALMAGREWIWVEGNHDPGHPFPVGRHVAELSLGPLVFRHIARTGATAEISGHYHPKVPLPVGGSRPAALLDAGRLILPAYGVYTGGLRADRPPLSHLVGPDAMALVLGDPPRPAPLAALCRGRIRTR
ncbi:MAG: ligase-associated DNA damage response endonuclease PdeM [Alphaproteobacteria bacterium]|nr:MAG: ligase-associated DNA damage response endonuclease PdeM [Alphaproteobacteria bacterium]